MKAFKRVLLLFLLISSAAAVSGCWNSRELNSISIILGVGIDKTEDGLIDVTTQIAKTVASGAKKEGDSKEKAYVNLNLTGDTLFDIFRNYTHQNERKLFFPQNQEIIFGSDLAKDGVFPYVDFFARDHECRMDVFVLVSKTTANEILNVEPMLEKTIAVELNALIEVQKTATSYSQQIELMEFVQKIQSKTTSALATLVDTRIEKDGHQVLNLIGMAVFKEDQMVGELNAEETRGWSWVANKVKGALIDVDSDKGKATIEVKKAAAKTKVTITEENQLVVDIKVTQQGTIGEMVGFTDMEMLQIVEHLEKGTAEKIKQEIEASLAKARKLNADYFGFADMFEKKYAKEFVTFKEYWDQDFRNVQVNITVESKITGTGRITTLNNLKKGE